MSQDEELHATAVKAAIQAVLNTLGSAPHVQVLDLDDVYDDTTESGGRPDEYVEIQVMRRYGGLERLDGYHGTTGWRITTRVVARTVTAARKLRKAVSDALLFVNLTVSGSATTPVCFETEGPIGEDDDYWVGLTDYTYTL